eukprot:11431457-Alexandrium_andersonii.AAC.1
MEGTAPAQRAGRAPRRLHEGPGPRSTGPTATTWQGWRGRLRLLRNAFVTPSGALRGGAWEGWIDRRG